MNSLYSIFLLCAILHGSTYTSAAHIDSSKQELGKVHQYDVLGEVSTNPIASAVCTKKDDEAILPNTIRNCDFRLGSISSNGELNTHECHAKNISMSLVAKAEAVGNNKMVVFYVDIPEEPKEEETNFKALLHIRIIDMLTCEYKEAEPQEMSVPQKRRKDDFYVTFFGLPRILGFYVFPNVDDTLDIFAIHLKSCDSAICKLKYNLKGELVEGPVSYFEKSEVQGTFYLLKRITSDNYGAMYVSGPDDTNKLSYYYASPNKVSELYSEIIVRPNVLLYGFDAAESGMSWCYYNKNQNDTIICVQHDSNNVKKSEISLKLSDSWIPMIVQQVPTSDGGFFLISIRSQDKSPENKFRLDDIQLQYVKPNGELGRATEFKGFNCMYEQKFYNIKTLYEDNNVCIALECYTATLNVLRRRCLPLSSVL